MKERDFESRASANSATAAYAFYSNQFSVVLPETDVALQLAVAGNATPAILLFMQRLQTLASKFIGAFGSTKAWYLILALFGVQAVWLALSMVYPGVFDEEVHFGTTQLYATQWSPFFDGQPVATDYLGQIAGQTSYLFYWVMSFVYRLLSVLGVGQVGIILLLRLINIALFAAGLVVGRKLLKALRLSPAATNLALFVFVMIPVVPQLAAQINYDNPLFLLTSAFLLLCVQFLQQLNTGQISLRQLVTLGVVGLTASLIKVAFLPIFAAGGIVLVGYTATKMYQSRPGNYRFQEQLSSRNWRDGLLVVVMVLVASLAIARYGSNYVNYGKLQPSCYQVLSVERCQAFGPYARDYRLNQQLDPDFEPQPTSYIAGWYSGMHRRLFFTINGKTFVDTYQNFDPLPVVSVVAHGLVIVGFVAIILRSKARLNTPSDVLMLSVIGLYVGTLLVRNYTGSYQQTGNLVAINGRYLLIVLLPLVALSLKSLSELMGRRQLLKFALTLIVIVGFIQGGGISGFIVRSHPSWWWSAPIVEDVNRAGARVVSPLLIGD